MFKPGEKIKCIDAKSSNDTLTEGKTYTVLSLMDNGKHVIIKNDDGVSDYFYSQRFKKLKELHTEVDYLDAFQENFKEP